MIGNDLHNIGAIHHFASKSNGWVLTDGTSSLAKKIGLATRQYQNIPQNKAKVIALVNSKENSLILKRLFFQELIQFDQLANRTKIF